MEGRAPGGPRELAYRRGGELSVSRTRRSYRNFLRLSVQSSPWSLVKAYMNHAERVPNIAANQNPSSVPRQEELCRYHQSFSDDASEGHVGAVRAEGGVTV